MRVKNLTLWLSLGKMLFQFLQEGWNLAKSGQNWLKFPQFPQRSIFCLYFCSISIKIPLHQYTSEKEVSRNTPEYRIHPCIFRFISGWEGLMCSESKMLRLIRKDIGGIFSLVQNKPSARTQLGDLDLTIIWPKTLPTFALVPDLYRTCSQKASDPKKCIC